MAILEIQGLAFIIMTCFSTKAFRGLWCYSKIAFSSLFVLSFESWFSIGLVLSAGFFASPTVSIASFAICLTYLHLDLIWISCLCWEYVQPDPDKEGAIWETCAAYLTLQKY
ncbi:hypothetical protein IFM89_032806 [Coptis chinensis]|uniref:Uncharacterized protein n=1 Tax=Coptis chinensis TaxID=261450 RepID=A0A835HP14_9MAGN|nr:hypothetical protein IFM89_032806 [Coptis chinensis]